MTPDQRKAKNWVDEQCPPMGAVKSPINPAVGEASGTDVDGAADVVDLAEDSLYLWSPELPEHIFTNYKADVLTEKFAAELVAAS